MAGKLNTKEVHERRHRRILDRHELESIISNMVHHEIRDAHGNDGDVDAADYKLPSRMRQKDRPHTRSARVASSMSSSA